MAKFKVIKAHDGLEAGAIRVLAPCPLTAEMVRRGYWEELKPQPPKKTTSKSPKTKKK